MERERKEIGEGTEARRRRVRGREMKGGTEAGREREGDGGRT